MTAVEWLIKELKLEGYDYTIQQAKEMEENQIINAFIEGTKLFDVNDELSARFNASMYFIETYGSKGSDEKIISQAHTNITRIKGKEYAPTSNEIQTEIEKSENPINLYDLLKKVADFWNRSEIPKPIFKQYLSEHNLDEIITSSQTEISDEEIEEASKQINYGGGSMGWIKDGFKKGAKWYREQLKKKQ